MNDLDHVILLALHANNNQPIPSGSRMYCIMHALKCLDIDGLAGIEFHEFAGTIQCSSVYSSLQRLYVSGLISFDKDTALYLLTDSGVCEASKSQDSIISAVCDVKKKCMSEPLWKQIYEVKRAIHVPKIRAPKKLPEVHCLADHTSA